MDFSDRLFAPKGKTQAILERGKDRIIFSRASRHIFSYLNDSRLTESKSSKDFITRAMPVLSMLIREMHPDNEYRIKLSSSDDTMQNLLDSIKKNKQDVKIFVLNLKPDEITENKPREIQASLGEFSDYQKQISKIAEDIKETNHLACVLLKTKLPGTMWGAKEVQKKLSDMQFEQRDFRRDDFDSLIEKTKNGSEFLDSIIYKRANIKKTALNDILTSIIGNFFNIKKIVTATAQNLHGLFDIDRVFKKATGYPATWFFDSSIFYDFGYNFENLVKDMVRCARLESGIIEPLFVWKVKMTGDEKCQII